MMSERVENFGSFLKILRIEAGFGLRKFADLLEMPASNLSAIEHGRRGMPKDKAFLAAEILGLEKGTAQWGTYFDLATCSETIPVDVQSIAVKGFIPALLRTIDNYQLTDGDILSLIQEIQGKDDCTQNKPR